MALGIGIMLIFHIVT